MISISGNGPALPLNANELISTCSLPEPLPCIMIRFSRLFIKTLPSNQNSASDVNVTKSVSADDRITLLAPSV